MRAIGKFDLVHSKDGVALRRMQAKPAAFNIVAFKAAQYVIELFMRRDCPEVIRPQAAALKKSKLHAKSLAFPQKTRVCAMRFHGEVLGDLGPCSRNMARGCRNIAWRGHSGCDWHV